MWKGWSEAMQPFAQEIAGAEQRDGCFLALFGDYAESYSPFLNVIDSVRRLSLQKDGLFRAILVNRPSDASIG